MMDQYECHTEQTLYGESQKLGTSLGGHWSRSGDGPRQIRTKSSNQDGEEWLHSKYILKEEPRAFVLRMLTGGKERRSHDRYKDQA